MQLTLTSNDVVALQAVAMAASTDKDRPIITTVWVGPAPAGLDLTGIVAAATDSYRLAYVQLEATCDDPGWTGDLFAAKALSAAAKDAKQGGTLEVTGQGAYRRFLLTHGTGATGGEMVEGTFPAWPELVPSSWPATVEQPRIVAAYNPLFLETLGKVARLYKDQTIRVEVNVADKNHPALFTVKSGKSLPDFHYLLMPVRVD